MSLGQEPGTPEFGERARQRREAIARMRDPETRGPGLVEGAVQFYGEKAKEALFGDLQQTFRTLAVVGIGIGILWFMGRRAR